MNEGGENVGAVPVVGASDAGTTGLADVAGGARASGRGGRAGAAGPGTTAGELAAGADVEDEVGAAGFVPALTAGGTTPGERGSVGAATGAGTVTAGRVPVGLSMLSEGRATGAVFVDPAGVDADGVNAGVVLPLLSGATGAIDAFSGALAGVPVVAVTAPGRFANNGSVAVPSRCWMRVGANRGWRINVALIPRPRRRHAAVPPQYRRWWRGRPRCTSPVRWVRR